MFISPKYILSDRLHAGLSCDSLLLIIGVSFGAIFMSVNIAERPTFEKTSSPKGNDAHLRALCSRYYACP